MTPPRVARQQRVSLGQPIQAQLHLECLQLRQADVAATTHNDDQRGQWGLQPALSLQPAHHTAVHRGQRCATRGLHQDLLIVCGGGVGQLSTSLSLGPNLSLGLGLFVLNPASVSPACAEGPQAPEKVTLVGQQAEICNGHVCYPCSLWPSSRLNPETSITDHLQIRLTLVLSPLTLATRKLQTGTLKTSLSSLLSRLPGSCFREQLSCLALTGFSVHSRDRLG